MIRALKKRQKEIGTAAVFIGLIIIPSGLLGYLSWRAIENEKLLSRQRLEESYRQLVELAVRQLDNDLSRIEKHWKSEIKKILKDRENMPAAADMEALASGDSLIEAGFLLSAPGKVVYPAGMSLREHEVDWMIWENDAFAREYETFNQLKEEGEEYEYQKYYLDAAIRTYRKIYSSMTSPQLQAMALSFVGRAYMKKAEWRTAIEIFNELLHKYPEVRDVNNMYLRFLAQYQIAEAYSNLDRDEQAIRTLLRLNRDLFERSDVISDNQYRYFLELIRALGLRVLASQNVADADRYVSEFQALTERTKKRISQRYFLRLLDRKLYGAIVKKKNYNSKLRFISDEANDEIYLLGYRYLPNASSPGISGVIGFQVDLQQLSRQLFKSIFERLNFSENVHLGILNTAGNFVVGTRDLQGTPIAARQLSEPFDFWQLAVYVTPEAVANEFDFRTTYGVWFISLLLVSIFSGAYIFIRRAWKEARLSQMKSGFVSNVSHELRTPIASIRMLAELLEMQFDSSTAKIEDFKARGKQYLGVITRECDRLSRLIENVLTFSKMERGVKQYNFEYEDPAAILHMAIDSFQPNAEAEGFRLLVDIDKDLPEVKINADAISQVMLNLLSNAIKYSSDKKEIRIRAFQEQDKIIVQVQDRGIGIPRSAIAKIFDDFYRVDQKLNSQAQGGIGLGLTLVRQIIRAHGGDVSVESKVGEGSTFTFTIPIPEDNVVPATVDKNINKQVNSNIGIHHQAES